MAPTASKVLSPLGSKEERASWLKAKDFKDTEYIQAKRESLGSLVDTVNQKFHGICLSPLLPRRERNMPTRFTSYGCNELITLDEIPTPDVGGDKSIPQRVLARASKEDAAEVEREAGAISDDETGEVFRIERQKITKVPSPDKSGIQTMISAETLVDLDTSRAVPTAMMSDHALDGDNILSPDEAETAKQQRILAALREDEEIDWMGMIDSRCSVQAIGAAPHRHAVPVVSSSGCTRDDAFVLPPHLPRHLMGQLEQLKQRCIANKVTGSWKDEDISAAIEERMNIQGLLALRNDNKKDAIKEDTDPIPRIKKELEFVRSELEDMRGKYHKAVAERNAAREALRYQRSTSITHNTVTSAVTERMMTERKTKAGKFNQRRRNQARAELEYCENLARALRNSRKKPFGF